MVGIVWKDDIQHDPDLHDDFVLFKDSNLLFKDQHDALDSTRVLKGEMIWNKDVIDKYIDVFRRLSDLCITEKKLNEVLGETGG